MHFPTNRASDRVSALHLVSYFTKIYWFMWLSEQKTFDLKNSLKCAEMRGRSQPYSHLTVTDLGKTKQKNPSICILSLVCVTWSKL